RDGKQFAAWLKDLSCYAAQMVKAFTFFARNLHGVCLTQKIIESNTEDKRVSPIPVQIARRQAGNLE
ncbi:MAG TPA: hypothetical protein VGF01_21550, partial [Terracidiphilus sp.]